VAKPPTEELELDEDRHTLLGPLQSTGLKPHFYSKLSANGVVLPISLFQLDGDLDLQPARLARSGHRR
jgi:hypothetical protein